MLPLKPHKWTVRRGWNAFLMRFIPDRKLQWDLRAYDVETRKLLSQMRSEKKGKDDIEEWQRERELFREEYSGPLWEGQSESLLRDGHRFGVYVEDVYGDDGHEIFDRDHFGARWLRDERKFRKALQHARKEASKESRERWAWRAGLIFGAIGSLSALIGSLNNSKGAIIDVIQAAIKAWKG